MRFLCLLINILTLQVLTAQVGINTMMPLSALDIRSTGNSASSKAFVVKDNLTTPIFELRDNGQVFTAGVDTSNVLLDLRGGDNGAILAVGQSSQTASEAGAGALRYNPADKAMYFSDNISWQILARDNTKAYMVADIINSTYLLENNTPSPILTDFWNVLIDNRNCYDATQSGFVIKREGLYSVSLNISLDYGSISASSELEAIIKATGGHAVRSITTFHAQGMSYASVVCAATFELQVGNVIQVELWHNLGVDKNIRIGYNNLTIVEL